MDFALERVDTHDDVRDPAECRRHRRLSDGGVAGVRHDDDVRREQLRPFEDQMLQSPGPHFLGTLGDDGDPDAQFVAQRP